MLKTAIHHTGDPEISQFYDLFYWEGVKSCGSAEGDTTVLLLCLYLIGILGGFHLGVKQLGTTCWVLLLSWCHLFSMLTTSNELALSYTSQKAPCSGWNVVKHLAHRSNFLVFLLNWKCTTVIEAVLLNLYSSYWSCLVDLYCAVFVLCVVNVALGGLEKDEPMLML